MGGAPQRVGVQLGLGLLALSCATALELRDGRWHAPSGRASIGDLAALEAGWRRTPVEGPLLAFEADDGARASWLRRCPGATASSRAEARALLVSLDDVEVDDERAVSVAGQEAWAMRGRVLDWGRRVELKTVTRAVAGCTDDFVLVAPALAAHEAGFDRWWASYQGVDAP